VYEGSQSSGISSSDASGVPASLLAEPSNQKEQVMRSTFLSGRIALTLALAAAAFVAPSRAADDDYWGLEPGKVELKSAGPISFGPEGVLFVSDAKAATIYAIQADAAKGEPAKAKHDIKQIEASIAKALNYDDKPGQVRIADLAVNPDTGNVVFAVTAGPENKAALVRLADGKLEPIALDKIKRSSIVIADAPESQPGGRRGDPRDSTVTDIAYIEGKLIVSGLSAGTASSAVREMDFPFTNKTFAANLELYHAAHGKTENHPAARTFVPFIIDGKPELLAGFTCTPLVRFPLDGVRKGEKIKGTTVAELGNRNQPIDMITYKKGGKSYLLMSNSARGVMKIPTEGIEKQESLTEPVKGGGTAGHGFETLSDWQGVTQLDKLNDTHAVVLIKNSGTGLDDLKTVELP
jgi:hypothetical protein